MADTKPKKLLIITSSGGGGHMQAAKAIADKILAKNPNTIVIEKDILVDWVSKRFGKSFVGLWNISQKKGNLPMISFLSKSIPTADIIFWILLFTRSLITLLKEDVDQIIDTQPVGVSPVIHAIRVARRINKKPLILEKIITELPTEKVIHFFKPIKYLSKNSRKFLKLISAAPLLKPGQTADSFWEANCGLKEEDVQYKDFPLRESFEKYKNQLDAPHKRMEINVKVKNYIEKFLIADTIKRGTLQAEIFRDKIALTIEPTDKVSTILLGSQPTEEATIKYVKNFIEMARRVGDAGPRHLLFVFCNHDAVPKHSLLRRVHDVIQKAEDYPKNLNIIPMCFQDDEVIAPLYYRSDATFTRSGGMTSMELLSVTQGKIWIHSEMKGATNKNKLHKGMPLWERGNVYYLRENKGAEFITPDVFFDFCSPYFLDAALDEAVAYTQ